MRQKIIICGLLVALASSAWLFYYFSDRQVIRRQLVDLAGALGRMEQESAMEMAIKLRTVQEMLPPRCFVRIPDRDYGKELEQDLIIRYLIYYRQNYRLLSFSWPEMEIELPAEDRATVHALARLERWSDKEDEAIFLEHAVRLDLQKGDEKWLLHAVTMPAALTE